MKASSVLTIVWVLASLSIGYPAYKLLASWIHEGLAATIVFLVVAHGYHFPYKARLREQNEESEVRLNRWRGR